MKFEIHHITTNEDEYDEIMAVIMKWERIDALNRERLEDNNGNL